MFKKMIEKEVDRQITKLTKDFNDEIDRVAVHEFKKSADWRAHASNIEEHGKQIERFLKSFETIAQEFLARSPKVEPVKEPV